MITSRYRHAWWRGSADNADNGTEEGSQMVGLVISLLVLIAITAIALPYLIGSAGSGDTEEANTALEMAEETADIADNNSTLKEEQYEDLNLDVTYTN